MIATSTSIQGFTSLEITSRIKEVQLVHPHLEDQVANIFAKPLRTKYFEKSRKKKNTSLDVVKVFLEVFTMHSCKL